jgi:hypothetical protein
MLSVAVAAIVTAARRVTVALFAGLVMLTVGAMPSRTVTLRGAEVAVLFDVS